jgi:hypothetical protein
VALFSTYSAALCTRYPSAAAKHERERPRMKWEESTLGERFTHMCVLRGITIPHLAKRAGMAKGPVYRLANRTDRIAGSCESMIRLADSGNVSLEWLLCGRGPIERRDAPPIVRNRKDWATAVEEARRRYGTIPERYFDEVGEMRDTGRPLTWQFVGRSAQLLCEVDLEAKTPDPTGGRERAAGRKRPP